MKTRVADYITRKLYEAGAEYVFMITGGMIMHLTDSLTGDTKMKFICFSSKISVRKINVHWTSCINKRNSNIF